MADAGGGSGDVGPKDGDKQSSPIELEEELTAGQFETLDEVFRRAYVQKDGKYFLNRKGRDKLTETLQKERDAREKAEATLKELGMPVEDIKKLLDEQKRQKKESQTEAEKFNEAILKAQKENEDTRKAMEMIKAELEATKLAAIRAEVQNALSIPAPLMKFLTGTTYEELEASGKELMVHVKPADPSRVKIGEDLPPGSPPPLSATAMEQQIKAGLEKAKKINEATTGQKEERRAY
jgi:DNA-binding transcriptional MerR regulator